MEGVSARAQGNTRPTSGGGYALRKVVVAPDLNSLRGPLHGKVRLPLHLDSSAPTVYDLDDPYFLQLMYRIVLLEAASVEDANAWLDRDTLVATWPELHLPPVVRAAWEEYHPVLRGRGAGPHVPQTR